MAMIMEVCLKAKGTCTTQMPSFLKTALEANITLMFMRYNEDRVITSGYQGNTSLLRPKCGNGRRTNGNC
jgi:hypothetical protein